MMRLDARLGAALLAAALFFACRTAFAQGTVLQSGSPTGGHAPMYVTGFGPYSQAIIMDSGPASGGVNGLGLSESLLQARTGPGQGTGPFGTHDCLWDTYSSNPAGAHYLCLDPNIGSTAALTIGSVGTATPQGFQIIINGTAYPFPGTGLGNVIGPTNPYPVTGNAVIWNGDDTVKDGGAPPALAVPSNAALQALSLTGLTPGLTSVLRTAFYPGVAGQPVVYNLTSANCGAPDNGAEVQPSVGTGCWLAQTVTGSPTMWGASGSDAETTCSIGSGSTTMTLGTFTVGSDDFVNGEPIFCTGAGANYSTSPPSLSVTATNGSGTTAYYTIRPLDANMGAGPAITPVSVSGGALLGNPQVLAMGGMIGTTHGSTTIDGLASNSAVFTASLSSSTMTVSAVASGVLAVGQIVSGTGITAGTTIASLGTGTGGVGTYNLNAAATTESGETVKSFTTCTSVLACGITINDYVKAGDVTPGTTVTAITGAAAITISAAASASNVAEGMAFISPTNGIFNALTITGSSANGYAIYKGTSNSLSAMTCIGVTSGLVTPWKDFGQTPVCAPWVPPTANVTQNDVYRGTIMSGAGTTTIQVSPAATNAVTGASYNLASHDDTDGVDNAVESGLPLSWNCGDYPILFGAVVDSSAQINGNSCATVHAWGPLTDFSFVSGSGDSIIQNFYTNDTRKSIGYDFMVDGAPRVIIQNITATAPYSFAEITGSTGNTRISDVATTATEGDYGIYLTASENASPPTFVNNPTFSNVSIGPGSNGYCFLADGDVDSITMYESGCYPNRAEFVFQNTVNGHTGPNLGKFADVAINNAWGIPLQMSATENLYNFEHLYLQCVQGSGQPGISLSASSNVHIGGKSAIFDCDKQGIDDFGQLSIDNSVQIWGNNEINGQAGGGYAKIELESGSGAANLQLDSGDQAGAPEEKYGVQVDSGAGASSGMGVSKGFPPIEITGYIPGYACPVNDQSGAYNLVQINGQYNSPTCEVATGGPPPTAATLSTTDMLGTYQTSMIPTVYVSGNVSGTGINVNLPSASAIVGAKTPTAVAGGTFTFRVSNIGGSTATLQSNSTSGTVTVSGSAAVAAAGTEVYVCTMTNVSGGTSDAVTCVGVI